LIMRFFSMGYLSNGGRKRNEIWHKGSLRNEDDVRFSNTRIAQRKRTMPHSTMKNNHNVIQCCNNTYQGAPRAGKQTCACALDLGDASHVTCKYNKAVDAVHPALVGLMWDQVRHQERHYRSVGFSISSTSSLIQCLCIM